MPKSAVFFLGYCQDVLATGHHHGEFKGHHGKLEGLALCSVAIVADEADPVQGQPRQFEVVHHPPVWIHIRQRSFSKFGGDLDATTKLVLDKGARNVEILKQPQYAPVAVEKQVAIIYLGTQGLLRNVRVNKVKAFEEHYLMEMENKLPEVLAEFKKGNLSDDSIRKIVQLANELIPQYK